VVIVMDEEELLSIGVLDSLENAEKAKGVQL
jgi:hypothetical protein